MPSIRLLAFLAHLSEILSEKRAKKKRQSGEHTRPGCGARRPRRAQGSVSSKIDNAKLSLSSRDHREFHSLAARALSGETPDNHTRGRAA